RLRRRLLGSERRTMAGMRLLAEGPGVPADVVRRVGRAEPERVGEIRLERARNGRAEHDREVSLDRLAEAVPVGALLDVARQRFERQSRVRKQQEIEARPRERA